MLLGNSLYSEMVLIPMWSQSQASAALQPEFEATNTINLDINVGRYWKMHPHLATSYPYIYLFILCDVSECKWWNTKIGKWNLIPLLCLYYTGAKDSPHFILSTQVSEKNKSSIKLNLFAVLHLTTFFHFIFYTKPLIKEMWPNINIYQVYCKVINVPSSNHI